MRLLLWLTVVIVLGSPTLVFGAGNGDGRVDFNDGWLFALTDDDASGADYDDSGWRRLDLPHDWAIEGRFSAENASGTAGGALPGGTGWYRKHFVVEEDAGRVFIDFDGVYMNSSVYVNGVLAGNRPYGYASFGYDITPFLRRGGENVVSVKVDNSDQPNSRWYSGCGIYRNVWLRMKGDIYIPLWGQHVMPVDVTADSAALRVRTVVVNECAERGDVTVSYVLKDGAGNVAGMCEGRVAAAAGRDGTDEVVMRVKSPELWSPERPALYRLYTRVAVDGRTVDSLTVTTGFRRTVFDADSGFSINGRRMKLNGVCLHHDAGALGAVVNRRAIERQLEMMKEMGVNAVRCSHNPPAPELLELCDSMGIMVMDEAFDMWRKRKTRHDYARYFEEWHERDLRDLVVRDRNHPSVIMWSIGNEVLEQWTDARADTLSAAEANLILNLGHAAEAARTDSTWSVNSLLALKLASMVRELDGSRPVTAGCNEPRPSNHLLREGILDIVGYNYHENYLDSVPRYFAGRPFLLTESVSGLATRGFYVMPADSVMVRPERWDRPFSDESMACSAYDNCHVPWGNTHERSMRDVAGNDFVMGQFVWTGFDYIGEPTPYEWPARSSYFGIVDLAGFPKDIYYFYQSQWRKDKDVLHVFPHWTWEKGDTVDVWAYYNNADEIELFVNGRSAGVHRHEPGRLHAAWRVEYRPGMVEAVARRNGVETMRRVIRTAGRPAKLRLSADRGVIRADGRDLCYVTVEVTDAEGTVCPRADDLISFEVEGAATVKGVDNGSHTSMEPFKGSQRHAFNGKALVIVGSTNEPGAIKVRATAPGLAPSTVVIESR